MVFVEKFVVGSMPNNTYVVWQETANGKIGALVDTPQGLKPVISFIHKNNIQLKYILMTHGHWDHIVELDLVRESFPKAEVVMAKDGVYMLGSADAVPGGGDIERFLPKNRTADRLVVDGEMLPFGDTEIEIMLCAGHTHADTCYYVGDYLFTGDTLFAGTIGRCDLPGGNYEQLLQNIKKFVKFSPETIVHPGHEASTTLAREYATNPYYNGRTDEDL